MKTMSTSSRHDIPDDLIAEASVWVARLHGPNRKEAERGVRHWLEKGANHARAFELATEVWDETGGLARVVRLERPRQAHIVRRVAALAAVVALAIAGVLSYGYFAGVSTNIGEQRLVTLEDGTRVMLNTATRLLIRYDDHERRVELKSGEALFDVAKQQSRPFVVEVGARQVRALGTSFVVRRDERQQRVQVTLVEGVISVQDTVLSPGERLTLTDLQPPRLDRPAIDRVTAWRRGQIVLDDTPLAEAVVEMNRYSVVKLEVERPETADLLVNGLFQAGDAESFAAAMAQTYGIEVVREPERIVLAGAPQAKFP
jgi:transmembrane sensor